MKRGPGEVFPPTHNKRLQLAKKLQGLPWQKLWLLFGSRAKWQVRLKHRERGRWHTQFISHFTNKLNCSKLSECQRNSSEGKESRGCMGVLFKRGSIDPMRMKKVNGSEGDSIVCEDGKII